MKSNDLIRTRIETKGVRSEDIKHQGRLTIEEIASIPPEMVYMWITAKNWKLKDFKRWLKAIEMLKT